MKKIIGGIFLLGATLFLLSEHANAQAIYGPQGQYLGYSQTSPNGVTNVYNAAGRNTGSFQTDNGQTSFYSPTGNLQGTSTAPIYSVPNTTIGSPRNAPQVRSVGGW